jgi:hypothetical protein
LTVNAYGAFGTIRGLFIFVKVGARSPRPHLVGVFPDSLINFDPSFGHEYKKAFSPRITRIYAKKNKKISVMSVICGFHFLLISCKSLQKKQAFEMTPRKNDIRLTVNGVRVPPAF